MKTKFIIPLLAAYMFVLYACKKKEFDMQFPNVEQFISLVKSGKYIENGGHGLPNFSEEDIHILVKYLKDTTEVQAFPTNPVSSKYTNPKILNECIMWTIEGIRLNKKYPSLEPVLIDVSASRPARLTKNQLLNVSSRYLEWHNEYKASLTETVKKRDILGNMYRWN